MCRTAIEAMIRSTDEDVVSKTLNIINGLGKKVGTMLVFVDFYIKMG